MTKVSVHEKLNVWLSGVLGIVVIRDRQDADRPAIPYGMTQFATSSELRQLPSRIHYEVTDVENSAGHFEKKAYPLIEDQWTFLLFVYGENCIDYLKKISAAVQLNQIMEPLYPLMVHEMGPINEIPEFINETWEPRAQTNLSIRFIPKNGFVIDTIEETEPYVIGRI